MRSHRHPWFRPLPLLRYQLETGGAYAFYAAREAQAAGVPLPLTVQLPHFADDNFWFDWCQRAMGANT